MVDGHRSATFPSLYAMSLCGRLQLHSVDWCRRRSIDALISVLAARHAARYTVNVTIQHVQNAAVQLGLIFNLGQRDQVSDSMIELAADPLTNTIQTDMRGIITGRCLAIPANHRPISHFITFVQRCALRRSSSHRDCTRSLATCLQLYAGPPVCRHSVYN